MSLSIRRAHALSDFPDFSAAQAVYNSTCAEHDYISRFVAGI
ncbi:hypothetical protein [Rarobacter incanus]|nr:hypothetical protein [Rarobacter incanus]